MRIVTPTSDRRLIVRIEGAVQGVGFRPFVYRLAASLGLRGRVLNDSRGVLIDLEGPENRLRDLLERLPQEKPPLAILYRVTVEWPRTLHGHRSLWIDVSSGAGHKTTVILPDVATCEDCRGELFDRRDRRYRYPFINCTNCGPRFSIVLNLPYDRPGTTMRGFQLCRACAREYEDPGDRRFHAQPNACPACGPTLTLVDADGNPLAEGGAALAAAAARLRAGQIVAMKGLGGFHLLADAGCETAVRCLRERKRRPDKPFAVMVRDAAAAAMLCEVPDAARRALLSSAAPVMLLRRRPAAAVCDAVAPDNPRLGVMVPYTPLHHLLMRQVRLPLVATSGNLSDEPICTDSDEARGRLAAIADAFLIHDRPIARHVDDSVAQLHDGQLQVLRRARGMAPLPVALPAAGPCVLAVGAHFKNVLALGVGDRAFLSQHIGDMQTPQAMAAFERVVDDFLRLYEAQPVAIAHDLHPDYFGSRWAATAAVSGLLAGTRTIAVQHHHAHLASCLVENGRVGPVLGIIWDGTGLGTDGTVWGGEFLTGGIDGFDRVAWLRPFRLPGGDAAVHRPARVALALAWQLEQIATGSWHALAARLGVASSEVATLTRMLERGFRSPWTTSAGRLFDGVAALLGIHPRVTFEGQAAMALEALAGERLADPYPMPLRQSAGLDATGARATGYEIDWRPTARAVVADCVAGTPAGMIASSFHAALVEAAVAVAEAVGLPTVALSGGCFQNRLLSEAMSARLRERGFEVLVHHDVPPNDGGICLGQLAIAAHAMRADASPTAKEG